MRKKGSKYQKSAQKLLKNWEASAKISPDIHIFTLLLRGPDCKYREYADSYKISQFILFYLKDPFGELFSTTE